MFSQPRLLLHIEAAAELALVTYLYRSAGFGWGHFFLLFLWPDLFMLGYLSNPRLGAQLYNLVHTATLPLLVTGVAYTQHQAGYLSFALIWLAHVAFDRTLGYGLKYPTFFTDTHLQRLH